MVNVSNRAGSVMLTRPFHTVTVASINTRPPLPTIPSPAELSGMNLIIEPLMDEPVVERQQRDEPEREEEDDDEDEESDDEEDTDEEVEEDVEDEEEAVEEDEDRRRN